VLSEPEVCVQVAKGSEHQPPTTIEQLLQRNCTFVNDFSFRKIMATIDAGADYQVSITDYIPHASFYWYLLRLL
jgi:hypothetical protein